MTEHDLAGGEQEHHLLLDGFPHRPAGGPDAGEKLPVQPGYENSCPGSAKCSCGWLSAYVSASHVRQQLHQDHVAEYQLPDEVRLQRAFEAASERFTNALLDENRFESDRARAEVQEAGLALSELLLQEMAPHYRETEQKAIDQWLAELQLKAQAEVVKIEELAQKLYLDQLPRGTSKVDAALGWASPSADKELYRQVARATLMAASTTASVSGSVHE